MGSPQVRTRSVSTQPPSLRPRAFDHESFAVRCPLALLQNALYSVLVHRLMDAIHPASPRFVTFSLLFHPSWAEPASRAATQRSRPIPGAWCGLHFAHCGQLAGGLTPPRSRPCWAHTKKSHPDRDGSSHSEARPLQKRNWRPKSMPAKVSPPSPMSAPTFPPM